MPKKLKPSLKCRLGRPSTAAKRAHNPERRRNRREQIKGYGLVTVEMWLKA